ncbi:ribonuclease H-like domain-containing protein [Tanacetum coccineum]
MAEPTQPSPIAQTTPSHRQPISTTYDPRPTGPPSHHPQLNTHSLTPTPTIQHQQLVTMAHSSTLTGPTTSAQHPPTRTHPMVTSAQVGTINPNLRFNFHTSHTSPLPKSPFIALSDPNWRAVMYDEYNALVKNSTWMLVPKPPNANVVRYMWLFRHKIKYHADGSLSRYTARLVANWCTQHVGIDCDDTFIPVVKPATIRTVLSLALSRGWHVYQLDVKNAFLNDDLHDIEEFKMTDLGALNYFLGISVTCDFTGMFLSQRKYDMELLELTHMVSCNLSQTLVDIVAKLGHDEDPVLDPTLYRSLAGGLQYLTFTRLDISYVLQKICLYMHDPREPNLDFGL